MADLGEHALEEAGFPTAYPLLKGMYRRSRRSNMLGVLHTVRDSVRRGSVQCTCGQCKDGEVRVQKPAKHRTFGSDRSEKTKLVIGSKNPEPGILQWAMNELNGKNYPNERNLTRDHAYDLKFNAIHLWLSACRQDMSHHLDGGDPVFADVLAARPNHPAFACPCAYATLFALTFRSLGNPRTFGYGGGDARLAAKRRGEEKLDRIIADPRGWEKIVDYLTT